MKLPIKKEYFDAIKDGSKIYEFRDAHITFICESTGRAMRKKIVSIDLIDKTEIPDTYPPELFTDDVLIIFQLKDITILHKIKNKFAKIVIHFERRRNKKMNGMTR